METQKGLEVNQDKKEEKKEELKENEIELKIDSVAQKPNEYGGSLSRGVRVENIWYNVRGDTEDIINKLFDEEQLAKGNTVIVEVNATNTITKFVKLIHKSESRNDDDMLSLDTLLADAHKKGLVAIKTQIISHDPEKKVAVFKAIVFMNETQEKKNTEPPVTKEYHGHGDADQINISSDTVKKHYLRMAESRSIVRALRWAVNSSSVSKEELI